MTLVKVCGMRDLEHMAAAAEAGADLLGMVFLPTVRRYIPPEDRRGASLGVPRKQAIGAPQRLVGLFADQPVEHVNAVAAKLVGLDFVQLCGSEPPDYWAHGWSRPSSRSCTCPRPHPGIPTTNTPSWRRWKYGCRPSAMPDTSPCWTGSRRCSPAEWARCSTGQSRRKWPLSAIASSSRAG